jgi:glutamate carboxypeptidase
VRRAEELGALFAARKDEILEDLEALVTRESPSDDTARVCALAAFIVTRLKGLGFAAESLPCPGCGDAVRLRIGDDVGGTLLLGHIDTVWPVGTLAEMPFMVRDGVATGPGVFDMKAGVAVLLAVLGAIAKGEVTPKKGVSVFLTPDEEIGSGSSRELIVAEAGRRDRVLVFEPSGDAGAAKVARKGIGLVEVTFKGIASHAGLEPEKGASALLELSRFVLFVDALADGASGTSIVSTQARAGSKTNVVPERAELSVDFRVWSAAEGTRVEKALHCYRPADERVTVTVSGGLNRPPMEATEAARALYQEAAELAQRLGFELPSARVGGASDGNLTAAAGVPTLDGLGPAGGGAHARSEHLRVDDLPRRAALLAGLLEELAR